MSPQYHVTKWKLSRKNYHVQIEGFTFLGENYHKIPRQAQDVVPSSTCKARLKFPCDSRFRSWASGVDAVSLPLPYVLTLRRDRTSAWELWDVGTVSLCELSACLQSEFSPVHASLLWIKTSPVASVWTTAGFRQPNPNKARWCPPPSPSLLSFFS